MSWIEARLRPGAKPKEVYYWLAEESVIERVKSFHHFQEEPWWPDGYVIRLQGIDAVKLDGCSAVDHVVAWDATPDEELYGPWWPWAMKFFEASSMLSTAPRYDGSARDDWFIEKFLHCFLNAHGMRVADERRFARRFWWYRATLRPRLWWRRQKAKL